MKRKENLNYPWASQFIINAQRCSAARRIHPFIREYLREGKDVAEIVNLAFSWSSSPQGCHYWRTKLKTDTR